MQKRPKFQAVMSHLKHHADQKTSGTLRGTVKNSMDGSARSKKGRAVEGQGKALKGQGKAWERSMKGSERPRKGSARAIKGTERARAFPATLQTLWPPSTFRRGRGRGMGMGRGRGEGGANAVHMWAFANLAT